ncbi:hypothetical protein GGF50DRAFT_101388, partial [Schizophyllum commune]
MQHTLRSPSLAMQPTLDPQKRAPHQEGWRRCLHRSADAPTPAMSMPPLRCRCL